MASKLTFTLDIGGTVTLYTVSTTLVDVIVSPHWYAELISAETSICPFAMNGTPVWKVVLTPNFTETLAFQVLVLVSVYESLISTVLVLGYY